ncbi:MULTISPECIES: DUF1659 domain-containing protein [Clostridium]|uniref:DUF1659 domain-containing protein n=1 Tax=Clostridium TaxID=1485 RepID=UPI00069E370B|nr:MULTISPECIES: DUF1659 domain-containing protein [Clostridium]KOF57038.1 hypothetical protein AGR56_10730 [Clostridium sp. DMHC 10]MCD2348170.1 DUF1659 domain-containing protein [Clostridium guangxiense]
MAANATKFQTAIQLVYSLGKGADGKDKEKTVKFSNVDITATDDDIYAVANVLASLMSVSVTGVEKVDHSKIING